MKTISVIIPTYNRVKYIGRTIESFIDQTYDKQLYEIIVVDNDSTDNTKDAVEQYMNNKRNIKITYLFENRQGVHYARNSGAKISKGEVLYFTDDDTVADKNLLNEIIKPFDFDSKVGTATGRVLPDWEVEPPKWILKHCYNYLLSILDPPEDFLITKQINYLYSCHQAIRRDVFFSAEGYNPDLISRSITIGDGEAGLNVKIKELGYKFGFNGKSVTYHIIPSSRMTQAYLNKRIGSSAYCHAYTEYRRRQPNNMALFLGLIEAMLFIAPLRILRFLVKAIYERDIDYFRFALSHFYYYRNKIKYNFKLATTPLFRKFILKKDWLTNDSEFYNEILGFFGIDKNE